MPEMVNFDTRSKGNILEKIVKQAGFLYVFVNSPLLNNVLKCGNIYIGDNYENYNG